MKPHILIALSVGLLFSADASEDKVAKQEFEELEGGWVLTSAMKDGESLPEKEIRSLKVAMHSNRFQLEQDGRLIAEGTFTVNAAKQPNEMDEIHTAGRSKGKTYLAIHEIDGDQRKLCFADAGKPRPTEFSSKPGSG